MEYISVKDAAEKWNISQRYVQRCCVQGRIEGAVKIGRSWAIPNNAIKPTQQNLKVAMPFLNTPYKPGHARDSIDQIDDKDTRQMALAEYYYFRGLSQKASDISEEYLIHQDIALRLSACWIYGYANMALNRIARAKQAMHQIQTTIASIDENTPLIYQAYAKCIATGASVLLHLPSSQSIDDIKDYIHLLPTGLRLFALYIQAHQAYLDKQYGICIGIAETALMMQDELYPIPSIYLHLVAAMGHINMRQSEQAKEHLLQAWKIAQDDDMIEPFGEHHGLLGGLLEVVLRNDYPNDFNRIIHITYSFSAGWRQIHNPETEHDVADNLTTMEFTIAMLASRNWSNKEIASHLNISVNTVKMHISSALQKLNISKRSELSQFMLK